MKKKVLKNAIKICVFITLANLPFLTITQLIGIDTFIDSFDNPDSYQYYKSNKIDIDTTNKGILLIQKPSHPDFSIIEGDTLFYFKDEGSLMCRQIYHISRNEPIRRYYMIDFNGNLEDKPIDEYQIVGKVVRVIDNNAWNKISLEVWELSRDNLNAAALFIK